MRSFQLHFQVSDDLMLLDHVALFLYQGPLQLLIFVSHVVLLQGKSRKILVRLFSHFFQFLRHAILYNPLLVLNNLSNADFFFHGGPLGCEVRLPAAHQIVQLLLLTLHFLLERLLRAVHLLLFSHGRIVRRPGTVGPLVITLPRYVLLLRGLHVVGHEPRLALHTLAVRIRRFSGLFLLLGDDETEDLL